MASSMDSPWCRTTGVQVQTGRDGSTSPSISPLRRFGPEEVSASRISYLVDGDSVCFENSGPPNDCIQRGVGQQSAVQRRVRPTDATDHVGRSIWVGGPAVPDIRGRRECSLRQPGGR